MNINLRSELDELMKNVANELGRMTNDYHGVNIKLEGGYRETDYYGKERQPRYTINVHVEQVTGAPDETE